MLVSFNDDHTGFGNSYGNGATVPGFTSQITSVPTSTTGDVSISLEYFGDFDIGGTTEALTINIEGVIFGPYTGPQYNDAFGVATPTMLNLTISAATWANIIKDGVINISYDLGSAFNNLSDAPNVEEFIKLKFEWDVFVPSVITGTNGDDVIPGTNGDDFIKGLGGDDRIVGRDGNDTIFGGDGNDVIWGGAGNDRIVGGRGDNKLSGGDGDDSITGGDGNERIWGGAGNDRMAGGGGNDTIWGETGTDRITGGNGDDDLSGGDGDDLIWGNAGNDRISGGSGGDQLSGGDGDDSISGGNGNDEIWGGAGSDRIDGGAGIDILMGGLGKDILTGGSGKDVFIFSNIKDSTVASSGRDIIRDFSRSQGDKIDLKAIDASTKAGGDQAFKFIGTDGFHKVAGELNYVKKNGDTFISGDVNGDGKADFTILLDTLLTLKASDFIL